MSACAWELSCVRSARSLTHSHSLGVIIRETANIYPDSLHLFISIPLPFRCMHRPASLVLLLHCSRQLRRVETERGQNDRKKNDDESDRCLPSPRGHGSLDRTAEGWSASAEAEGLCALASLHCGRTDRGRWTHVRIQRDSRWMVGKFQLAIKVVLLMWPERFPHTHAHAWGVWGRPVCRKSRSRKEKEYDMHAIRREGEDPAARPA